MLEKYNNCFTEDCVLHSYYEKFAMLQRKIHTSTGEDKRILNSHLIEMEKRIIEIINKCGESEICLTKKTKNDTTGRM